jgi:protein-S-isoprenylcysteine O-methyltransferase Ste14
MLILLYLLAVVLFLFLVIIVYRKMVHQDYLEFGRLTPQTSILVHLIWIFYFCFPFIYNPPVWILFWRTPVPVDLPLRIAGMALISLGILSAAAVMVWFGIRRSLGLEVGRLINSGPYRLTRNPQLLFGGLIVAGYLMLWPSLYAAGWVVLYGFIAGMMVHHEEQNLLRAFGREYTEYTKRVPRYLGIMRRITKKK